LALMAIKNELNDPHNVLENWDSNFVDPCRWRMITCNLDGSVSVLEMSSQNLSDVVTLMLNWYKLLQNNAISGQIPTAIRSLEKLQTLDLSNNDFSGEIPNSLGDLKSLNYFLYFNKWCLVFYSRYYAERTSKQTAEILKRKGKGLESQLDSLKAMIKDLQTEAILEWTLVATTRVAPITKPLFMGYGYALPPSHDPSIYAAAYVVYPIYGGHQQ
ncbi:hypothetical protein S83_012621, partial [Arachis hypogaea]